MEDKEKKLNPAYLDGLQKEMARHKSIESNKVNSACTPATKEDWQEFLRDLKEERMTVDELIEKLQEHARQMGGDNGCDEIAIWYDGSYAKLMITDCIDKNKFTEVVWGE